MCPLCRKPLPARAGEAFDLGYGMYMKIKTTVDRAAPGVIDKPPGQRYRPNSSEMDEAVAMMRKPLTRAIWRHHCGMCTVWVAL